MADKDSNIETNLNKRINMNITMNIELKNSEAGKGYEEILKDVTKNAMTCLDAALNDTNTLNREKPNQITMDNKIMARLRRNMNYNKNLQNSKINHGKASSSKKPYTITQEEPKTDFTNIETDKGVATEAMKRVRHSLQLKNSTKNRSNNSNTMSTVFNSDNGTPKSNLTGTKRAKNYKEATNKTTNEDKPSIETEAMKSIRRSLELRNKAKRNSNVTASTSTFSPTTTVRNYYIIEGTGNTERPKIGLKRKIADEGIDKIQKKKDGMKRKKFKNTVQESDPNTISEIEQMDIDDYDTFAVSGTGTNDNTSQQPKRALENAGLETEAMKMIRLRLELKNRKQNDDALSNTRMTSPASRPSDITRVIKDKKKVKVNISPKAAKRKTATVDKPTEEMLRIKELIEQSKNTRTNKTFASISSSRPQTPNTTFNFSFTHKSVPKYNYVPDDTSDITEDESDGDLAVLEVRKNLQTTNTRNDESKGGKQRSVSERSSNNSTSTSIGKTTRSKTWERRVWKKN